MTFGEKKKGLLKQAVAVDMTTSDSSLHKKVITYSLYTFCISLLKDFTEKELILY